jgi:hypothetical protein
LELREKETEKQREREREREGERESFIESVRDSSTSDPTTALSVTFLPKTLSSMRCHGVLGPQKVSKPHIPLLNPAA